MIMAASDLLRENPHPSDTEITPDIVMPAHPPMATDEVRYVGEAVACVVARDRYMAATVKRAARLPSAISRASADHQSGSPLP